MEAGVVGGVVNYHLVSLDVNTISGSNIYFMSISLLQRGALLLVFHCREHNPVSTAASSSPLAPH